MRAPTILLALLGLILLGALAVGWASSSRQEPTDNPWRGLPPAVQHVDHTPLIEGPLETGPQVTIACLACHPTAAQKVM